LDRYASDGQRTIEGDVVDYIISEVRRKREKQLESDAVTILNALQELLKDKRETLEYQHRIEVKSLCEKVKELEGLQEPPKSKKIARVLRNLHLYKEPKRVGKSGGYSFKVSKLDIDNQIKRFGLDTTEDSEGSERSEVKMLPSAAADEHSIPLSNNDVGSTSPSVSSENTGLKESIYSKPSAQLEPEKIYKKTEKTQIPSGNNVSQLVTNNPEKKSYKVVFQCPKCPEQFTNGRELKDHAFEAHQIG
jgi:hypothetical protein